MVYGSEKWSLSVQQRRKLEVFEKMCLRSICGIRRVNRMKNLQMRKRFWCELSVLERVERNILKWFGHVEGIGRRNIG